MDHSYSGNDLLFHGVHIVIQRYRRDCKAFEFNIDPLMLTYTAPILENIFRSIRKNGFRGVDVSFELINGVNTLEQRHNISARLYGTHVKLISEGPFEFKDVTFYVTENDKHNPARLNLYMKEDSFSVGTISDLLRLLTERRIIFYDEHNNMSLHAQ